MLTFTIVRRPIGDSNGGFYRQVECGSIVEAQELAVTLFGVENPKLSLRIYRDPYDSPICSYCCALDEWISLPAFD